MTTSDYPKGRSATAFSFVIGEKALDTEEIVTENISLALKNEV